jgi:hypothetical protein
MPEHRFGARGFPDGGPQIAGAGRDQGSLADVVMARWTAPTASA